MNSLVDRLATCTLRRYGSVFNGGRVGSIFSLMNICVIKNRELCKFPSKMWKKLVLLLNKFIFITCI